jgi:hypothetical protein
MEFLRRFAQQILPRGFARIRQSGFLANTCRTARVALARTLLTAPITPAPTTAGARGQRQLTLPTRATWTCPHCGAAMICAPHALGASTPHEHAAPS